MFMLVVLTVSIFVGLARGGKLSAFADLDLKLRGVLIAGFLIQVLVFSSFWQGRPDTKALTVYAYILSNLLLLVGLLSNLRIPGVSLLTIGLLANALAIIMNGGHMPVSPEALALSGLPARTAGETSNNSVVADAGTQLLFLTDVFAIPKEIPLHNVFSLGDICIAFGAAWLAQAAMIKETVKSNLQA
jgi:hypothetical protein